MPIHNRFQTTDWQFAEEPNTLVLTSRQVLEEHLPVLEVAREPDGGLRFMSGRESSMADARFVILEAVLLLDATLHETADTPAGHIARRSAVGEPWVVAAL